MFQVSLINELFGDPGVYLELYYQPAAVRGGRSESPPV